MKIPINRTNHASRLSTAQALTLLGLLETVLLQPDGLDGNEASGVSGLEVLQGVHRGLLGGVELLGAAGATKDVSVTLVQADADLAVDAL